MIYPELIENAIQEINKLPGIGKKSALRLILFLLKTNPNYTQKLSNALNNLVLKVKYCKICCNISDQEICNICKSNQRDHSVVCIVENIQDVFALESTNQHRGVYHVLRGVISPLDGIGPESLTIQELLKRIEENEIKEIIFALSATIEGDTTAFYIYKKLKEKPIRITTIARGIAVGSELEYTDEVTLGNSLLYRNQYHDK